jgi:hypothetical protein
MTVVMMRAQAKPEHADEIESAAGRMFAAIKEEEPAGISYTAYRARDTGAFVIVLEIQEGIENPLPAIAEISSFQKDLRGGWLAGPPSMEQLTVVGEYRSI